MDPYSDNSEKSDWKRRMLSAALRRLNPCRFSFRRGRDTASCERLFLGIREEVCAFDLDTSVEVFRNRLFSRFSWVPSEFRDYPTAKDSRGLRAWLVWKETCAGPWIIDYAEFAPATELAIPANEVPAPGLLVWLNRYQPRSIAELAVAWSLYGQHLWGWCDLTDCPDVIKLNFEPHAKVDTYLRPTRGMILWSEQLSDLFDMAGSTNRRETINLLCAHHKLTRARKNPAEFGWMASYIDPYTEATLNDLRIDGRPLLGILDERLVFGTELASPNFHPVNRLLQCAQDER